MNTLRVIIAIGWVIFWVGWLLAAFGAKRSRGRALQLRAKATAALAVVLLFRVFRGGGLEIESVPVGVAGIAIFASGLGLAVWARVQLGRNWGMPATEKAEPELVTAGPYRLVRHPIYSGILAGVLGTALVTNLTGLIVLVVVGGYFVYSARIEERNLTATFPSAYPAYRAATKMIIPFVL